MAAAGAGDADSKTETVEMAVLFKQLLRKPKRTLWSPATVTKFVSAFVDRFASDGGSRTSVPLTMIPRNDLFTCGLTSGGIGYRVTELKTSSLSPKQQAIIAAAKGEIDWTPTGWDDTKWLKQTAHAKGVCCQIGFSAGNLAATPSTFQCALEITAITKAMNGCCVCEFARKTAGAES